ncbi:hypothetical protein BJ912DRAFT_979758 [Pholiota molesta]|nr:hypothetical protein BJ912DRAFT_979758 [Pholiota molesta]
MHFSRHCFAVLATSLLATVALAASAVDAPVPVHLRIEGEQKTIFEGTILTRGHNVTTASGGTHECNGLNNDANPQPGATCTSALADAARQNRFSFDGTFNSEFDDFLITSIGGETQTATQFWGILNNFQFTPVGGCQQEVRSSDKVLFAFDAFNKAHFLELSGPATAQVGHPTTFWVVDGATGQPVAGATVHGQTSATGGSVSVTFPEIGEQTLKASKSDSIRSNAVRVVVL